MFDRGCGFTEFLVLMFYYLPWSDIENSRLVCTKWRDFIDRSAVSAVQCEDCSVIGSTVN